MDMSITLSFHYSHFQDGYELINRIVVADAYAHIAALT